MCLLVLSLYGHPESGAIWESHCSKICSEDFVLVPGNPGTWKHKTLPATLNIYVDDFALTANDNDSRIIWRKLEQKISFKDPAEPIGRYLGAYYSTSRVGKLTNCSTTMEEFFVDMVERYKKEVGVKSLPKVDTPYLDEDFDEHEESKLKKSSASHLMKGMFGARIARPDSLPAICLLARRISKWTVSHDKMLRRRMSYLEHFSGLELTGCLSTDDLDVVELWFWPDADLGGDLSTTKSTSGFWLELSTPDGSRCWPLAWGCAKQSTTATSTCESETKTVIAGLEGEAFTSETKADLASITGALKKTVIATLGMLEFCLGRPVKLVIQEDNSQCITAVKRGYSPALRYLQRHCRMDLGFSNEVVMGYYPDGSKMYLSEIRHAGTATHKGDFLTKPLDRSKFGNAKRLIGMQTKSKS